MLFPTNLLCVGSVCGLGEKKFLAPSMARSTAEAFTPQDKQPCFATKSRTLPGQSHVPPEFLGRSVGFALWKMKLVSRAARPGLTVCWFPAHPLQRAVHGTKKSQPGMHPTLSHTTTSVLSDTIYLPPNGDRLP